MKKLELLLTPSNLQQFSLKCVSLRSIELPRDQAVFHYPGQIQLQVFLNIEEVNEKEKTPQTTSVCVLSITYKYIFSRVKHKSRLLSLFVSSLYCYQVSKKGITIRGSADIHYTFILIKKSPLKDRIYTRIVKEALVLSTVKTNCKIVSSETLK